MIYCKFNFLCIMSCCFNGVGCPWWLCQIWTKWYFYINTSCRVPALQVIFIFQNMTRCRARRTKLRVKDDIYRVSRWSRENNSIVAVISPIQYVCAHIANMTKINKMYLVLVDIYLHILSLVKGSNELRKIVYSSYRPVVFLSFSLRVFK